MVDAVGRGRGDGGLGMERDAGAGQADHVEIVGTIADGDRIVRREAETRGDRPQRIGLGGAAENGLGNLAGEAPPLGQQRVRLVFPEAEHGGDAVGEGGETAGDEKGEGARRIHGRHEFARAGSQRDALGDDAVDDCGFQSFQQRDALAQRALELDLPVHGTGGDGGDMLLEAHDIGQFVDAFLVDHGGIHVGDEDVAAAVVGRLDHAIDRRAVEFGPERGKGLGLSHPVFDGQVAGDGRGKPVCPACADGACRLICERLRKRARGRIGDQSCDEGHGEGRSAGMLENAILIAGPTASGKSRLALELARPSGATVVNADSMQVYSILRVLTARPNEAEMEAVPHALYGHVHPSEAYSTGRWLDEVAELVRGGRFDHAAPIFVGGTGLYFKALLEGLSPMPDIPTRIREHWRARLEAEGATALHAVLAARDPEAAGALRPGDGQRIVRALEVLDASGRSILDWQAARGQPLVDPDSARLLVLDPDRAEVVARIEKRFDAMVEEGAIDEVRALMALGLSPRMPAMKAIGVRELAAVIDETMTLTEAVEKAKAATRQYAKRQSTWFRNQFDARWQRIRPGEDVDP